MSSFSFGGRGRNLDQLHIISHRSPYHWKHTILIMNAFASHPSTLLEVVVSKRFLLFSSSQIMFREIEVYMIDFTEDTNTLPW